ncbi:MAG: SPOR domain-containing protein, partial [Spirochaetota bacterium]
LADAARDDLGGLFRDDLEAETRYIEVESIEEAVKESERLRPSDHGEPVHDKTPAWERDRPEPPEPGRPAPPKKPAPAPRVEGIYYIQVASFTREENARAFAEKLRKNLYKVVIEEAVVDGTTFHRVRVGPFEQRSVAVNTMAAMKRRYNLDNPFVVAKRS